MAVTRSSAPPPLPQLHRRTLLAQLLVVSEAGRVLLVHHCSGPFAGFKTGLIEEAVAGESAVSAAARAGLGLETISSPALRGIAVFHEEPKDDDIVEEHEFVCRAAESTEAAMVAALHARGITSAWYAVDGGVPFDQMPADDAIWYPPVLVDRRYVRAEFTFSGAVLTRSSMWVAEDPGADGRTAASALEPNGLVTPGPWRRGGSWGS